MRAGALPLRSAASLRRAPLEPGQGKTAGQAMKVSEGADRDQASADAAGVPGSNKELPLEVGSDAGAEAGARGGGVAAAGQSANRAPAASQGEAQQTAAGRGAASAQDGSSMQAPGGDHSDAAQQPAVSTPKEGAFLFSSPSGCCSSLRPDRVRARGADVATPVATPQTAAPTGNIFARKSSQGINTGPRSCAFCSRTFCSQHALDIHLSRNMVPRFDVHARACACTCLLAACASCDRDLTPGLLRRSAAPCTGSP